MDLQRHWLVRLRPDAGVALDACSAGTAEAGSIVSRWLARARPLIARRPLRAPDGRLCLGLPLPPDRGKLRLACLASEEDVERVEPPPLLAECLPSAPPAWRGSLGELDAALRREGVGTRVFGALAWTRLTGLAYLGPDSDADLLALSGEISDPAAFGRILEQWPGPARGLPLLDVEIVLPGGAGFSWKEFSTGAESVLVKGNTHVRLLRRDELATAFGG